MRDELFSRLGVLREVWKRHFPLSVRHRQPSQLARNPRLFVILLQHRLQLDQPQAVGRQGVHLRRLFARERRRGVSQCGGRGLRGVVRRRLDARVSEAGVEVGVTDR